MVLQASIPSAMHNAVGTKKSRVSDVFQGSATTGVLLTCIPRGGCLQICSVLACWVSLQSMHQEANMCMHHCFLPLLLTFNMLLAYFGVMQLCAWCVSAFCSVHKYCELCWSNCQSAGPHDARTAAFWGVHSTRALTASTAHVHGP